MRIGLSQSLIGIFSFLIVTNICYGAGTAAVSVSALVLSKGNCTFNSNNLALSFGILDPGNPIDQDANTTVTFTCRGNGNDLITFSITHDSGLYETGPNAPRMRNTTRRPRKVLVFFVIIYLQGAGSWKVKRWHRRWNINTRLRIGWERVGRSVSICRGIRIRFVIIR